jgi:eukaryotic translation initiation factor 2C
VSSGDGAGPLEIGGRVLPAPTLKYGAGSREASIVPRDGAWNMVGKKFFQPCTIVGWCVVVFERQQRFPEQACQDMIQGLIKSTQEVGASSVVHD